MPSEMIDSQGVSTSFLSEEIAFPDEGRAGFWKTDAMHNYYGLKTDGSLSTMSTSPLEKRTQVDSEMVKGFGLSDSYLKRDQKCNPPSEKFALGSERVANLSLPRGFDVGSASYFTEGAKKNFMGAPYENSLFSSSLSEIFTRKLRLPSNNSLYGHSVGAADPQEGEEPFGSLEELESQTIGNLLPDDDDLFSGVGDGNDYNARLIRGDEIEDLDLFCNVGGLELGEDGSLPGQMNPGAFGGNSNSQMGGSNGKIGGEQSFVEHLSRTLFVRNINSNTEDSELRALFEVYGDIRSLYTACKHRGFVMISYYDFRAASNAMKALQNKPLQRRMLDIHFSIPKDNPAETDINQGTLVVLNLDSSVSNDELRQMFGVYGDIKEIRESPQSHHKFIEFYDIRAAEAAAHALNRSDMAGKQIKLEQRHLGGARWSMHPPSLELEQDKSGFYLQQNSPNVTSGISGSIYHGGMTSNMENGTVSASLSTNGLPMSPYFGNAFHHGVSSSVPNSLPSLLRVESVGNQSNTGEAGNSHGQLKFEVHCTSNLHPHSLPDYHNGLSSGVLCKSPGNMAASLSVRSSDLLEKPYRRVSSDGHPIELNDNGQGMKSHVFNASGNGSCPSPGHHYTWSNSHRQPQGIMWPNSPSSVNGASAARPQQLYAVARAPSQLPYGLTAMNNHHVGSAPSVNPSLWERRHGYAGESPDASVFHPGSLGSMRMPGNSAHFMEFIPPNMFPRNGGSCLDLPISSKDIQLQSHNQRCLMIPARGQMIPMMNSFDSPNERTRSRRNEGSSSHGDNKKQFELDIDRIVQGEDKRTTLMIKNIPNKYTSKMLLAAIDECHRGTYDFLYLPIDFKNKCNVGYAFINMTDPSLIIPFYYAFNGKKWEKFNSEKVASLAYARIQGKGALVAHFQNSSLMNEDKRCRPILFHTDGPNAGDQVPFPMGVNIRPRPSKNRSSTSDENNIEEGQPNSATNEEESINGNSSSATVKDSD